MSDRSFVIAGTYLLQYIGTGGDVTVPDGITEIRKGAFAQTDVTRVTLPESLEHIGERAFSHCGQLTRVDMPRTLTSIGECAFLGCKALREIDIPDGIEVVSSHSFYLCEALRCVQLPQTLRIIGMSAFCACSSLCDIRLPDGLTALEWGAFDGCRSLRCLHLPASLTEIRLWAFRRTSLARITVDPANPVLYTHDGALYSRGGTLYTRDENGVSLLICQQAAAGCFTVPEDVTAIGNDAFASCTRLREIRILHDVDLHEPLFEEERVIPLIIPALAPAKACEMNTRRGLICGFLQYPALYSDEIAACYRGYLTRQRKALLAWAFETDNVDFVSLFLRQCPLTAAVINRLLPIANDKRAVKCAALLLTEQQRLATPAQLERLLERELMRDPLSATALSDSWSYRILPDGSVEMRTYKGRESHVTVPFRVGKRPVTALAPYLFSSKKHMRSEERRRFYRDQLHCVTIPDGVTRIGSHCFFGCAKLTDVHIPPSVQELGERAFASAPHVTLHVQTGSPAHDGALAQGLTFQEDA